MYRANECSKRPSGPFKTRLLRVETDPFTCTLNVSVKCTMINDYGSGFSRPLVKEVEAIDRFQFDQWIGHGVHEHEIWRVKG